MLRPDRARQSIVAEESVEQIEGVIGIGVGRIGRRHILRNARQGRCMGGQVDEGDLTSVALGHRDLGGQILAHRIVKRDLAFFGHIGQGQTGEDLGDRADLEQRVPADRPGVPERRGAEGDDASLLRPADPYDDADAVALRLDTLGQNSPDRLVGGKDPSLMLARRRHETSPRERRAQMRIASSVAVTP